jgi:hypothetical protein
MTGIVSQNVGRPSGLVKATSGGGAWTLIKEITASGDATISFINGGSGVVLDSTYPIYVIKWINAHPSTETNDAFGAINFTIDGTNFNVTKTTSYFYANHNEADSSTGLAYSDGHDIQQGTGVAKVTGNTGAENDQCSSGKLWIFDPSSSVFVKHFLSQASDVTPDGTDNYAQNVFVGGYCNTTSAVTGVQFSYTNSADYDSGTFKLYGLGDS